MSAGKALAAFAVAVGGAVCAFAVYTFGWHEDGHAKPTDTSVRTVHDVAGTHRVIRLRYGDVVLRPEAATQCLASGEGGRPNLFCTRLHGGRHQVIFYSDSVLVWPLSCARCGPDRAPFSYLWTPYVLQASRERQSIGKLELRDLEHMVTYRDAIRAFGRPTSCRLLGGPSDAQANWRSLGVRLRLATLGGPPAGTSGCTAPRAIYIHSAYVSGTRWQTTRGLRVGLPVEVIRKLYPGAIFQRNRIGDWPGPAYWIVHVRQRCLVGVCRARFQTVPRLSAFVRASRVAGFFFPVGAEGE